MSHTELPSEESVVQPSWGARIPRFSPFVTGLAALVLTVGILMLANLILSTPRLERVKERDRALALIVTRTMDLEYALARTSAWEYLLYEATAGWTDELAQAVDWYEELAEVSSEPLTLVYLAVLEGESGRRDRVQEEIRGWDRLPDPFPAYAELLRAAYVDEGPLPYEEAIHLQDALKEVIPSGWFADRLAVNLAGRAGDQAWLDEVLASLDERSQALLWRARLLLAMDLGLLLLGVILAASLTRQRRSDHAALTVGRAVVPPRWPGSVGAIVLVRGGALWIVAMSIVWSLDLALLRVLAIPLTYLPLLILAHRHLLSPVGLNWQDGLGLVPHPGTRGRCWRLVAVVTAAGLLGEWVLAMAAGLAGLSSHWTEGFDEAMVWGDPLALCTGLLETIVFAPVFEEIVFRGLFFATLRRRFGFLGSALVSAAVFAIAHGYGLLGFASVLWSGVLWAWVYEQSGSVLPGILAHMVNNASVSLSIILFLR
jgi:hypothetical protein